MTNTKHLSFGSRCFRYLVFMFLLVGFSSFSPYQIEARSVTTETSQTELEVQTKPFVKPRPAASSSRINWTSDLAAFVIFMLLHMAVPKLTPTIYKRFSAISLRMRRLFLMPIKLTSTSSFA
ncbi:hypothetical protein [Cohnella terricola]|uniref:Uncharacterized protein n=1 Tax=Cohnella terricola TaxID=1289167 RepID=A0A559JCW2_9BACL|nr:hypothetical protein [Cohnella terricola]TVX97693.1 hypothetical protein FPZ45_18150 [Cohnella terricola]